MDGKNKIIVIAVVAILVGGAIGAVIGVAAKPTEKVDTDDTYNFYLYFGENNAKNGWYSAKASNAADGFKNAMDKAGLAYVINNYGYISTIDGKAMDYCAEYLWSTYDKTAASSSILYPVDSYGSYYASNGWRNFNGYDVDAYKGFKLEESNAVTFLISGYDPVTYTFKSPVDLYSQWSVASGTPFATA